MTTYSVKKHKWNNWYPFAELAFRKLALSTEVSSFASIGTGPGLDTVGAINSFKNLNFIVVTDLDFSILKVAKKNIFENKNTSVLALVGSLCQPLLREEIKVDLIYENLPNVPEKGKIKLFRRASCYPAESFAKTSEEAKTHLLESHYGLLKQARNCLNSNGSVVCSIGGRVPLRIIKKMVIKLGYKFEELITGFKLQTEIEEVLPGYASAEKEKIKFNFYKYDKAVNFLKSKGINTPFIKFSAQRLKELLNPYKISAKEALCLYQKDNSVRIGHLVHMIRAQKS